MAEALTSLFLEIVIAPAFSDDALAVLATKPNLRVLVDEALASDDPVPPSAVSPTGSLRTAGGAVLVTAPDIAADAPSAWTCATRRAPTDAEALDLDLAWRLVRGVTSNAIVLVRERRLVGLGSGQTSRVDAARQAVAKAHAFLGPASTVGASCASDAFYPFPDAVEACLEAGVRAIVQPGGSVRDAEAIAAVDAVGGTMLITGVRHFRH
jgi:phosphoribosylaminoimidazolecarboxamide formyltransferase/IMP cyclohydrolase